ncbi:MAG: TonB-dependent receptor [Chryseobacterium sp.]|nr:MAG: TonB-dependent receptor [Chryseobacterium sp.]
MRKAIMLLALIWIAGTGISAQERKLNLTLRQQPIKELFKQIEKHCGYGFIYSDEVVKDTMLVSLKVKDMAVSSVLGMVLSYHKLVFNLISEKLIAVGHQGDLLKSGEVLRPAIFGTIKEKNGIAIPFVSITLLGSADIIEKTLSDDNGQYQLNATLQSGQSYRLLVSAVGYKSLEISFTLADKAKLQSLVMSEDAQTLQTVTVVNTKPLIERKTDRYIVNVENGSLAQGLSAFEVLQKSPGIWVNQDGSIRIKGNQSVMVMINDIVQRMSQDDLAEYLKSLRSEDISKIEVIYNPPAEFEAAGTGGIVHIVLKKARKDGLNGSLNARYQKQGKGSLISGGSSLAYKIKRLYLSANGAYTNDTNFSYGEETFSYPDASIFSNTTVRSNKISRYQYRFSAAYDISINQSLAIQNTGSENQPSQLFLTDIIYRNITSRPGYARADWDRAINFNSTTINYIWKLDSLGSSLKVIGDYSRNAKDEQNQLLTTYSSPSSSMQSRTMTPSSTGIYAGQIDYTKNWKNKLELKGGIKYSAIHRDNESISENFNQGRWINNALISNQFFYKEQLGMLYTTLEKTIGRNSLKIGLRAEQTLSNGISVTSGDAFKRKYLSLFPSVYLMRLLNDDKGSSLFFNYSRRLQRPSFNDLNPYRLQVHDYMILTGNPDLLPHHSHNFQVGYNFLSHYNFDLYYSSTSNLIALLANTIANNVVEYKSFNFKAGKEYGLNINASPQISKAWKSSYSLSLYRASTSANNIGNTKTTLAVKSMQTISLKKVPTLDVIAEYKSPSVSGNTRLGHMFYLDLMLSQKILKDKATLRVYLSDLFNTVRETEFSVNNGTVIDFYQKRQTRNISLSFSYNFSLGSKFNQNNIEQSNKEENKRMGN